MKVFVEVCRLTVVERVYTSSTVNPLHRVLLLCCPPGSGSKEEFEAVSLAEYLANLGLYATLLLGSVRLPVASSDPLDHRIWVTGLKDLATGSFR